jgi:hypothetical protein
VGVSLRGTTRRDSGDGRLTPSERGLAGSRSSLFSKRRTRSMSSHSLLAVALRLSPAVGVLSRGATRGTLSGLSTRQGSSLGALGTARSSLPREDSAAGRSRLVRGVLRTIRVTSSGRLDRRSTNDVTSPRPRLERVSPPCRRSSARTISVGFPQCRGCRSRVSVVITPRGTACRRRSRCMSCPERQ